MNKLGSFALNLLFPPRCPICDKPVRTTEGTICRECSTKPEVIKNPYCVKCGKPLFSDEEEYCKDCIKREHFFVCGRALYRYESLEASIYRFKYAHRREYASYYGSEIVKHLKTFIRICKPDALIPVPISEERKRQRGYNQAELIANEVGKQLNIPMLPTIIIRVKNTLPQKGLNAVERQKNLKKAFKITQNDVKLSTIIIIDDIYTTGSTIDAISKIFIETGVRKIYFITLAIATGI